MKKQPYTTIHIYPQPHTFMTYINHYNKKGEHVKEISKAYIVEHIYEIILPIVEENPNNEVRIFLGRKSLDLLDVEQSYHNFIGE